MNVASTTEIVPSASAIESGNHTPPPNAACRSAMIPQEGGRIHEIGCVQAGRIAVEKTSPDAIQTGYSSRFDIAFALR